MTKHVNRADVIAFSQYGLSVFGAMALGLLLVLVLVRLLPPDLYGRLVLVKASFLVIVALFGMGLSQSAVRWSATSINKNELLGTVLVGAGLAAIPAATVFIIAISYFGDVIQIALSVPFLLATLVLLLCYLLNTELLNWFRATSRPMRHAVIAVGRATQQLVSILTMVFVTNGPEGYIYGLAVGELLFLTILLSRLKERLTANKSLFCELISYGFPHALIIACTFLLNYSDRFMISILTDQPSSTAYYDAASFAAVSLMSLLLRPFNLFLLPAYTKKYEQQGAKETEDFINALQNVYLCAAVLLATFIVIFRNVIMDLFFPSSYSAATDVIYLLLYSILINGVFVTVVAGLYVSKRPTMISVAAVIAVVANIALNYFLIPIYGLTGAALSTVTSSFIQLLIAHHFAKKILYVKLPLIPFLLAGLLLYLGDRYIIF